jgi:hypothetical protein
LSPASRLLALVSRQCPGGFISVFDRNRKGAGVTIGFGCAAARLRRA